MGVSHLAGGVLQNEAGENRPIHMVCSPQSAPFPYPGNITEQEKTEAALRAREEEIHGKSKNLEEMNAALKVILKQREDDRRELEEEVLSNVDELIVPNLTELRTGLLS